MARLELIPADEEREIRAAVRGICDSFPEDYSPSPAIVGSILARHGTEQQKEQWLRGIAAGTNSHNLATSLERRDGRLLLNGQKTYISGVEHADAVLVVAMAKYAAESC